MLVCKPKRKCSQLGRWPSYLLPNEWYSQPAGFTCAGSSNHLHAQRQYRYCSRCVLAGDSTEVVTCLAQVSILSIACSSWQGSSQGIRCLHYDGHRPGHVKAYADEGHQAVVAIACQWQSPELNNCLSGLDSFSTTWAMTHDSLIVKSTQDGFMLNQNVPWKLLPNPFAALELHEGRVLTVS